MCNMFLIVPSVRMNLNFDILKKILFCLLETLDSDPSQQEFTL